MADNNDDNENTATTIQVGVLAAISYRAPAPPTSTKGKSNKPLPKGKLETKNKEFSFTFEGNNENYLGFLSTLLEKHTYSKYTPVLAHHCYTVKIGLGPKKPKKDAIDVENLSEYLEIVHKIIADEPTKLTVYFNLDDVKVAYKKKDVVDSESEGRSDGGSDKSDTKAATAFEKELARNRLLLEEKYQNPDKGGYSFLMNDGVRRPLTPVMMLEWSRAMYDHKATVDIPPESQTFDPMMRARSIATPRGHASQAGGADGSGLQILSNINSILNTARVMMVGEGRDPGVNTLPLGTPWQPALNKTIISPSITMSTSTNSADTLVPPSPPPFNSPSKLPAFLKYAEKHLGIRNATRYQDALEQEGFGPDILHLVDNQDIIACGLSHGDAIRIKRGAEAWWNGPDAKRHRRVPSGDSGPDPDALVPLEKIRFVRVYPADKGGGGLSVFGTGVEDGKTPDPEEFTWHFYNKVTKRVEPLALGKVPILDLEYQDTVDDDV